MVRVRSRVIFRIVVDKMSSVLRNRDLCNTECIAAISVYFT